jgi:ElaB/YqjD/DUF883 family membrane-anchored ribosome-binding protein
MSSIVAPSETTPANGLSTWDEIRQLSDEIEVKLHLAGMEARDRWIALKPRLDALQRTLTRAGNRASKVVTKEVAAVRALLERLTNDVPNGN